MKKILIFTLVLILIGSFFVSSAYAATMYQPIYKRGDPSYSGFYSPVTASIYGTFQLRPFSDIALSPIGLEDPIQIFRDDRDSDGFGQCFWIINITFTRGFDYNSDFVGLYKYDTIQIVLLSYDQEPTGILNDLNILGDGGLRTVLYHRDGNSITGVENAELNFGTASGNYWYADDYGNDAVTDWYFALFGGPLNGGEITPPLGLFKPVIFQRGGAGPGGGSSGGGFPGGSETDSETGTTPDIDQPAEAFSEFAVLVFNLFQNILSIEFFGGFFSLADLLGIVFSLALLLIFVKWFAGG